MGYADEYMMDDEWPVCWLTTDGDVVLLSCFPDSENVCDVLDDGEGQDALIRDGEMPSGEACCDIVRWHGFFNEPCYLYWPNQTLAEWFEGNYGTRLFMPLPDEAWDTAVEALETFSETPSHKE